MSMHPPTPIAPPAAIVNPFDGPVVAKPASGAMVEVESKRATVEAQAAVAMAKQFPRSPVEAMDRILNACMRPGLAQCATYAYARGGSSITGPSIRLAEALAQNWGNVQFGIRELDQRAGVSTVEAYAWDLETNTKQVKVFQVNHVRHTKKGSYKLEDPRDIYETIANNGARRLRACLLGIIPGDVIDAALAQCNVTLTQQVNITSESITKMLDEFSAHNVTAEMIEGRIQRRLETILPQQMVSLRNILNSLNDGMSKPSAWFDVGGGDAEEQAPAETKTEAVKNKIKPIAPAAQPEQVVPQGIFSQSGPNTAATAGEVV